MIPLIFMIQQLLEVVFMIVQDVINLLVSIISQPSDRNMVIRVVGCGWVPKTKLFNCQAPFYLQKEPDNTYSDLSSSRYASIA